MAFCTSFFTMGSGLTVFKAAQRSVTRLAGQQMKMVLVVRTDLAMGKGKVAAQCSHAAVECYRQGSQRGSKHMSLWFNLGQPKVVLKVTTEGELVNLYNKSKSAGLICSVIKDAGMTQLQPGTLTVLGIGPGPSDEIDSVTSHLKLY